MAGKDGKALPYNPADYAPEWRTDYHPKVVDEPFTLHGEGFPGPLIFCFVTSLSACWQTSRCLAE
jgi:hypothetical protein